MIRQSLEIGAENVSSASKEDRHLRRHLRQVLASDANLCRIGTCTFKAVPSRRVQPQIGLPALPAMDKFLSSHLYSDKYPFLRKYTFGIEEKEQNPNHIPSPFLVSSHLDLILVQHRPLSTKLQKVTPVTPPRIQPWQQVDLVTHPKNAPGTGGFYHSRNLTDPLHHQSLKKRGIVLSRGYEVSLHNRLT